MAGKREDGTEGSQKFAILTSDTSYKNGEAFSPFVPLNPHDLLWPPGTTFLNISLLPEFAIRNLLNKSILEFAKFSEEQRRIVPRSKFTELLGNLIQ